MQVGDVMTTDVEVVPPDATLQQAAGRMRDLDVGALPVAHCGRLVGLITGLDIVRRAVAEGLDVATTRVGDAMSPDPLWCSADQDVDEAVEMMELKQVDVVPVVEKTSGRIVGILTVGDLVLRGGDRLLADEITRQLAGLR